jgi:GDP-L-fucose synthase
MKALVIGATGLVGGRLYNFAQQNGVDVVGTYCARSHRGERHLDFRNPEEVRRCMDAVEPDVVFLAAAMPYVDLCEQRSEDAYHINVQGAETVARAVSSLGGKLVFYSTDYLFDGEAGPYSEDDPASPLSVYGRTKKHAERLIRELVPNHLILRTTVVFGWDRESPNFAMQVWQRLSAGQPMFVAQDQWSNPTLAEFLAETSFRLVEMDAHGVFNVVGKDRLPRHEFARALAETMRLDATLIRPLPTAELGQHAPRPLQGGLKPDKLRATLGIEPPGLKESLSRFRAAWQEETKGPAGSRPHLAPKASEAPEAETGDYFRDKRIVVTGGAGFLGQYLVEMLRQRASQTLVVPRSADCDLRQPEIVCRLLDEARPDILFHLAYTGGGIGANVHNPGRFFYDNLAMGLHVIEAARRYQALEKLIIVGTTCAYPKHTPVPFREVDLWNGYPEETNAPYGVAKRVLLTMAQAYRAQYGLKSIYLIPANLYGPRDNFDLESSHVIPALIRRFVDAKQRGLTSVTVWGTGQVTREFLYVEDAARGLLLAAERYDGAEPANLATGVEIRVRDLVEKIKGIINYEGEVVWDASKPDGQPRRCLDVQRAWEYFGFRARTDLDTGLQKTIAWYLETQGLAVPATLQPQR